MADPITNAELAEEAGRLSFEAMGWINQMIGPREAWNAPAPPEVVERFLAAIRGRLDAIEARTASVGEASREP